MDYDSPTILKERQRPQLPRRAVVTAGMPYGSKDLHFGHVGGVFVQADVFARFLRGRIGTENVLFVSGTDGYGSPIVEAHREATEAGFSGDIEAFVADKHAGQQRTLELYGVALDVYAVSCLEPYRDVHREMGAYFLEVLHANGHLQKRRALQFYDAAAGTFLNGRQVLGRCPVQGCRAEKAYADECALGHPYEPAQLIAPRSALSGGVPELRPVEQWYVDMPALRPLLEAWMAELKEERGWRPFALSSAAEHLEKPVLHVREGQEEELAVLRAELPDHEERPGRGKGVQLHFGRLEDMEEARGRLVQADIRCRSGKTLVPFRLTGDLEWGLEAPALEGLEKRTFWVWPESLWAPLSFTAAHLGERGDWRDWWCDPQAKAYQFIGEDNVFFYGPAQTALFLGVQGPEPRVEAPAGMPQLTQIVANRHLLFLDKKASSSGQIKPPSADELLEHYTAEQLRAFFFAQALGKRSVSFRPKPFDPQAKENDPVLKEGNVLTNAFNRSARSCFYTAQKYCDGVLPTDAPGDEVVRACEMAILDYEAAMLQHEFHVAWDAVAALVRDINQRWTRAKPFRDECPDAERRQALAVAFHQVRVAATLLHPVAPEGTEMIRRHLGFGEEMWSWEMIFAPLEAFVGEAPYRFVPLEARQDFFPWHPSQRTQ